MMKVKKTPEYYFFEEKKTAQTRWLATFRYWVNLNTVVYQGKKYICKFLFRLCSLGRYKQYGPYCMP